jgi:hypothetical protein
MIGRKIRAIVCIFCCESNDMLEIPANQVFPFMASTTNTGENGHMVDNQNQDVNIE